MSFQPVIIGAGLVGWNFLQSTYDTQFEAFGKSQRLKRDTTYFTEKIGDVFTAQELVSDQRLLRVALGAFGLSEDLDNRYFIQKILEDGTNELGALANRLADDRYKRLSEAFGFGPGDVPKTFNMSKMSEIVALFKTQSFEVSVGEQDDSMRIALYAQRELAKLAGDEMSEDAKWFTIMGLPPLREILEIALGLPNSFGQINIDKQLEVFKDRASARLGEAKVAQFSDPNALNRLTSLYLAQSQIASFDATVSSGSTALVLLQASGT